MQIFRLSDTVTSIDLYRAGIYTRSGYTPSNFPPSFQLTVLKEYLFKPNISRAYFIVHSNELELPIYPPYNWKVELDGNANYQVLYQKPVKEIRFYYHTYVDAQIGLAYYTGHGAESKWYSTSQFPNISIFLHTTPVPDVFTYQDHSCRFSSIIYLSTLEDAKRFVQTVNVDDFLEKFFKSNSYYNTMIWEHDKSFKENLQNVKFLK